MTPTNDPVRKQYEQLPYPPRDPADEAWRLIETVGDQLDWISHYGFNGKARFNADFRILVAGGGTGDSVIYLAEQLRHTGSEIVYIDLSHRSMAIARDRARARELHNIRWIRHSLLDLAGLELGCFDYINCCGVLHHLPDPVAGLGALMAALKPRGLIFLMLYGKAAREPVYQMQALLRKLSPPDLPLQTRIEHAIRLLLQLPDSSLFKQTFHMWENDVMSFGEAGLADLLLHPIDQAFDVDALHALVRSQGAEVLEFVGAGWSGPIGYEPGMLIDDVVVRAQLAERPASERQAIAELFHGQQLKHQFYVGRDRGQIAQLDDPESVPVLTGTMQGKARSIGMQLNDQHPQALSSECAGMRLEVKIPGTILMRECFLAMDGLRNLGEIHEQIRLRLPNLSFADFVSAFADTYSDMNRAGWIMLSDRQRIQSQQQTSAPAFEDLHAAPP